MNTKELITEIKRLNKIDINYSDTYVDKKVLQYMLAILTYTIKENVKIDFYYYLDIMDRTDLRGVINLSSYIYPQIVDYLIYRYKENKFLNDIESLMYTNDQSRFTRISKMITIPFIGTLISEKLIDINEILNSDSYSDNMKDIVNKIINDQV